MDFNLFNFLFNTEFYPFLWWKRFFFFWFCTKAWKKCKELKKKCFFRNRMIICFLFAHKIFFFFSKKKTRFICKNMLNVTHECQHNQWNIIQQLSLSTLFLCSFEFWIFFILFFFSTFYMKIEIVIYKRIIIKNFIQEKVLSH